ncbi:MAG: sporulation protein YabP [Oscillospiraceae bacterium]|nr:sporulation protein YabP [Oscillospiraceae bacterium]
MPYDDSFKQKAQAQSQTKSHSLTLEDRSRLSLSGVEEVASFDEGEIVLRTALGGLTVGGEGLTVSRLDVGDGNVEVQGKISELRYDDTESRRGRRFGLLR